MRYTCRLFDLPPEFTADLSRIESRRTICALFLAWVAIIGIVQSTRLLPLALLCVLYVPIGLLIAGRQGALLQVIHEGSHKLVARDKRRNDFIADWFAALPVGLTLAGYTAGHMRHHAHTGTGDDLPTDLEKHEVTDLRDARLYGKLLRDLSGVTALRSFLGHNARKDRSVQPERLALSKKLHRVWRLCLAQAFVLAVVFQFRVTSYLLFWIVPLLTFNMLLMRIRGIAEHGLPGQLTVPIATADEGNFFTRSALTPLRAPRSGVLRALETALIGSLSCNFHHEHHLYPNVPFYNLQRLHERIATEVDKYNPDVYVESYLVAFLMGRRA